MCLDLKAQFLMDKKNFVEAENLFREAIKVATLIHGSKGEQVLVVSNSLATVLRYLIVVYDRFLGIKV